MSQEKSLVPPIAGQKNDQGIYISEPCRDLQGALAVISEPDVVYLFGAVPIESDLYWLPTVLYLP